ncbi:MAG: leucyl/phenylalanyl-tRNA--protein transferase [Gammaproteobacteria bacterium]|nr:leucyl/phenylalanyl-tRNA--protein transferase [Gammaproteobacteria bacterium]
MIFRLNEDPYSPFPDVALAETEPNGLLALGGDLSPERLINAYRHGIFPWFSENEPILWWSPDPRTVLYPTKIRISRSLRKTLRKGIFRVSFDNAFAQVITACSQPRKDAPGTWLVPEMIEAYLQLHALDLAHSVEVWQENRLIGGLYGVAIGGVFYGESMFSRVSDSSKVALVQLCSHLLERGFRLIDCQVYTEHLISLGAEEIPRERFCGHLDDWCTLPVNPGSWSVDRAETITRG